MNVFCFTGNLGQDAETRFTQAGDPIVSFSVAVKSGYGEREKTTWVRCSMFGKRGESLAPYLSKGQQVAVSGELSLSEWTDRDGMKRSNLEVRVNDLTLTGRRNDSGAQNQNHAPQTQQSSAHTPQRPAQNQYARQSGGGASFADMEDDIPF